MERLRELLRVGLENQVDSIEAIFDQHPVLRKGSKVVELRKHPKLDLDFFRSSVRFMFRSETIPKVSKQVAVEISPGRSIYTIFVCGQGFFFFFPEAKHLFESMWSVIAEDGYNVKENVNRDGLPPPPDIPVPPVAEPSAQADIQPDANLAVEKNKEQPPAPEMPKQAPQTFEAKEEAAKEPKDQPADDPGEEAFYMELPSEVESQAPKTLGDLEEQGPKEGSVEDSPFMAMPEETPKPAENEVDLYGLQIGESPMDQPQEEEVAPTPNNEDPQPPPAKPKEPIQEPAPGVLSMSDKMPEKKQTPQQNTVDKEQGKKQENKQNHPSPLPTRSEPSFENKGPDEQGEEGFTFTELPVSDKKGDGATIEPIRRGEGDKKSYHLIVSDIKSLFDSMRKSGGQKIMLHLGQPAEMIDPDGEMAMTNFTPSLPFLLRLQQFLKDQAIQLNPRVWLYHDQAYFGIKTFHSSPLMRMEMTMLEVVHPPYGNKIPNLTEQGTAGLIEVEAPDVKNDLDFFTVVGSIADHKERPITVIESQDFRSLCVHPKIIQWVQHDDFSEITTQYVMMRSSTFRALQGTAQFMDFKNKKNPTIFVLATQDENHDHTSEAEDSEVKWKETAH